MKNLNVYLFIISLALCLTSYAQNIVINYGPPSPNSGHVILKLTNHVKGNCTVNDSLMVENLHLKSLTIKNIPSGLNSIQFSGRPIGLKEGIVTYSSSVTVSQGRTHTQLLAVQTKKTGYWYAITGSCMITFISISAIFISGFF